MKVESMKLALFNKKTEVTGSIYQISLGEMVKELDKIVTRGFIGGVSFSQEDFHKGDEYRYSVDIDYRAGKLLRYDITTESDGGVTVYGDVDLTPRCMHYKDYFPDTMAFSINAIAQVAWRDDARYMDVVEIRGFDFVTVRKC